MYDRIVGVFLPEGVRDNPRAEVKSTKAYPYIQYYDMNGIEASRVTYPGKTLEEVNTIAQTWANGVKVLND